MFHRNSKLGWSLLFLASLGCAVEGAQEDETISTAESALTASGLSATLSLSSSWGSGYCADVALTNVGTTPITTWEVQVDLAGSTLSNGWSAVITTTGGRLIAKPLDWNKNLAVGAKTNFGFCASTTSSARPSVAAVAANGSGTGGTGGSSNTGGTGGSSAGGSSTGGTGGSSTGGSSTGGSGSSSTGGSSTGGTGTGGVTPPAKFVGNITTGNSIDTNGKVFSNHWNQITAENAGKWGSVQSSATSGFNWSANDAIYDYAQRKGVIFKEHTFVWGAQQPSGTLTETHVRNWMQAFCQRYPKTAVIDVVNEPPPHTTPSYANAIGGGTNGDWKWIVNAFKWARQYCPNATLIMNDYNNIEYADQNQHFINIVKAIKAAGAPIDAVGVQAHGLGGNVSTNTMKTLITKLHNDTGLPVYVTEYDIDLADDQAQLNKYKEHIPFFLQTDWVKGVTLWGWIYGSTWIPSSGLIRNGTNRPAMNWLMDTLGRPRP